MQRPAVCGRKRGTRAAPLDRSNRRIATAEALTGVADWNLPWVDLAKLVERSSAIFEYPMLDRDPLPRWSFGRVTLLGDAGHPMFPMGMNGGSRSVVDARVLAWCLAREHDPVTALHRYDTMRRPTVNAIVLANRELGPEKIIARAGERGGALPVDEATETASDYKELTRATVAQVNSRASWTVSGGAADAATDPAR